ncbi:BTAD domain-containing putative transcriptional regulator [Glycomyces salinus]|uniref:BTAD domain-containing putative transcriptional regulator n=1 Tax=Glycomyces salinus TaxID=980294 RepID=UPI0018EDC71C|nr:BTAD domain-containing putative transcriptional regulator [Glycomyces salinus]
MRVDILGSLTVRDDRDRTIPIGGRRLGALLTRLALDADRTVSATALGAAVWPDREPADPKHALQALVSRLRAVLPDAAEVRATADGYRLAIPAEAVDVHRFERLAAQGRRALEAGDRAEAARLLHRALDLWRGEPLTALPDQTAAATRLKELRQAAIEDRVTAELPDDPAAHIPELTGLAAAHPTRERLHALLIDALRLAGRQAEALAAFETIREHLAVHLGADPGPALREAHLAALRAEPALHRGNLKVPLGSLIGREAERNRIAERLTEGRLVTLVGPGGVGKTRLAATVAAEARRSGGVWMVELASVTDPGDVARAAAAALGLREVARPGDAVSRLVEALGAEPALLVLDNCEHIIDAAADLVAALLGPCRDLTILATGREPIGITGELLFPVLPLDTESATRLFIERAKAVRPDFEPSGPVTELCRRLDGLPLAVELAAARLRSMSLETMASKLDDRFALLRGGDRTSLPRHKTMQAVVAWSWDLLTDSERDAAERLAVFTGGFTAEAAEHVGAPVESLVDKSLVQFDGDRYRMFETIREFVLARSGEPDRDRVAHAVYFLDLAERAEPHLCAPEQLTWLARLLPERENLNAAVDFACESGDADTAVRLTAALAQFWAIQGEHDAAANRLRAALSIKGTAPEAARESAATTLLFHAIFAGKPDLARDADPPLRPEGPLGRALLMLVGEDHSRSAPPELGTEPADPWKRGMYAMTRSLFYGDMGDMAEMGRELVASAAEFRRSGDRWGRANALSYAALASTATGDYRTGIQQIEEAIEVAAELGSDAYHRVTLSMIRVAAGETERARDELTALLGTTAGLPAVMGETTLAEIARHAGDLDEAAERIARASAHAETDPILEAMAMDGSARLLTETGRLTAAADRAAAAFKMASRSGDMGLVAMIAVGTAMRLHRQGETAPAAELLGAASPWEMGASSLDNRRLTRLLREEMGERAFTAAFDRGAGLDGPGVLALVEAHTRR